MYSLDLNFQEYYKTVKVSFFNIPPKGLRQVWRDFATPVDTGLGQAR
jgi:hypothetical protein